MATTVQFKLLCIIVTLISSLTINAQGVAINDDGSDPDESAILDVSSAEKGILIPRMTKTQRNAITNPAKGLLVYDISEELLFVNSGTSGSTIWEPSNSGWNGSKTRIKILPSDIMATAKVDQPKAFGYENISGTNNGILMEDDNTDLVAFVSIPAGYIATHVKIYGNDTVRVFYVYESDIDDVDVTSKGSANVGSEADITDINSSSTNFLVIVIDFDNKESDKVYGGYVTIKPM